VEEAGRTCSSVDKYRNAHESENSQTGVSRTRVCGGTNGALHSSKMEGALYSSDREMPTGRTKSSSTAPATTETTISSLGTGFRSFEAGASRTRLEKGRCATAFLHDKYRNADWKTQTKRTYPSRPVGGSPDPAFILLNFQQSFIKTNSVLSGVLYCELCISSHLHFLSLAAPLFWAPVPCPGFPSRSFPRPGSGFRKRVAQKPGNGKQKNELRESEERPTMIFWRSERQARPSAPLPPAVSHRIAPLTHSPHTLQATGTCIAERTNSTGWTTSIPATPVVRRMMEMAPTPITTAANAATAERRTLAQLQKQDLPVLFWFRRHSPKHSPNCNSARPSARNSDRNSPRNTAPVAFLLLLEVLRVRLLLASRPLLALLCAASMRLESNSVVALLCSASMRRDSVDFRRHGRPILHRTFDLPTLRSHWARSSHSARTSNLPAPSTCLSRVPLLQLCLLPLLQLHPLLL